MAAPARLPASSPWVFSYLNFAVTQPAIFRLMFGHKSAIMKARQVDESGQPVPEERHRRSGGLQPQARPHRRRPGDRAAAVDVRAWSFIARTRRRLRARRAGPRRARDDRRGHPGLARCTSREARPSAPQKALKKPPSPTNTRSLRIGKDEMLPVRGRGRDRRLPVRRRQRADASAEEKLQVVGLHRGLLIARRAGEPSTSACVKKLSVSLP